MICKPHKVKAVCWTWILWLAAVPMESRDGCLDIVHVLRLGIWFGIGCSPRNALFLKITRASFPALNFYVFLYFFFPSLFFFLLLIRKVYCVAKFEEHMRQFVLSWKTKMSGDDMLTGPVTLEVVYGGLNFGAPG